MYQIELRKYSTGGRLLGTRDIAFPIRDKVETALAKGETVELDFAGTNPTQSFVDELVGTLVISHGRAVLGNLLMKNCNEQVKAILHFVVSDRLSQLDSGRGQYLAV